MALASARTAHAFERERPDGTVIEVRGVPLEDGGFVTTYMDVTERRRSQAKIVHMALHDALTDLPNRVLLNERLEQALTRVRRGEMVAVHLLDLDHFKTVNDTLGHPAGDKLLKMVTERLRSLVRETDTIARMGGDEFAVLQVAIDQPADATALALRIIEAVSAPYDHRRAAGGDRHQRRHRRRPVGRHEPRPADPELRPGALPRQGRRARHLSLLRAGDGRADAGAPRSWSTTCARPCRPASSSCTTSPSSISGTTRSAASRP